jgi:hypothetical protein
VVSGFLFNDHWSVKGGMQTLTNAWSWNPKEKFYKNTLSRNVKLEIYI